MPFSAGDESPSASSTLTAVCSRNPSSSPPFLDSLLPKCSSEMLASPGRFRFPSLASGCPCSFAEHLHGAGVCPQKVEQDLHRRGLPTLFPPMGVVIAPAPASGSNRRENASTPFLEVQAEGCQFLDFRAEAGQVHRIFVFALICRASIMDLQRPCVRTCG